MFFWILQALKRVNSPKTGSQKIARLPIFSIHNMLGNKKTNKNKIKNEFRRNQTKILQGKKYFIKMSAFINIFISSKLMFSLILYTVYIKDFQPGLILSALKLCFHFYYAGFTLK